MNQFSLEVRGAVIPKGRLLVAPIKTNWEPTGPGPSTEEAVRAWDPVLQADRLAVSLCLARDRVALPLARAARGFVERKGWFPFGYARLEDHARERFGRSGRWVRDLAALAEAAERLPGLAEALTGDDAKRPIGRVLALLIGRAASAATASDWIAVARTLTVREFQEEVRKARRVGSESPLRDGAPSPKGQCTGDEDLVGESAADDDCAGARCTVRFAAPALVGAAFDEARDLHSAVSGGHSSLTSFVEALVAEAHAGPDPPAIDPAWYARRLDQATRERTLAIASGNWASLREPTELGAAVSQAEATLHEVLRRCGGTDETITQDPDGQIRSLTRLEEEIERRLGTILAQMGESEAWRSLFFAGVGHYGEERLGISRTTAEDRARLARALRGMPAVREAYEEGRIGLEAAALVRRALSMEPVDLDVEQAWVAHARQSSVKRLRDELRLLVRETSEGRTSTEGGPPDDAIWFGSLRRQPGAAFDRVARFGRGAPKAPATGAIIRLRLPVDLAASLLAAVGSRVRALEELVKRAPEEGPWLDPDPQGSLLAARTFSKRCGIVPEWVGLLALTEDFVTTWDNPSEAPKRAADAVYTRDGWRCQAPGCTSRQNLEEHHILYRSRGGTNDLSNRTCLCRFHHQEGEHGGLATCRGTAPLGIFWRLGRDGIGGWFRNEKRMAGAWTV